MDKTHRKDLTSFWSNFLPFTYDSRGTSNHNLRHKSNTKTVNKAHEPISSCGKQLYKRLYPSVGLSVRPSVGNALTKIQVNSSKLKKILSFSLILDASLFGSNLFFEPLKLRYFQERYLTECESTNSKCKCSVSSS